MEHKKRKRDVPEMADMSVVLFWAHRILAEVLSGAVGKLPKDDGEKLAQQLGLEYKGGDNENDQHG